MELITFEGSGRSGSGSGYGYGSGDGSGDGDGYGYGSGYGSGDGDGYGDGSGYGSGDGDGYGDGSGSGYGSGDGDGYGSGYGDGYGYGYGSGDGYGDGYGDGDSVASEAYFAAIAGAVRYEGILSLWKSDTQGRPSNGGSGTVARVGLIEEIEGPLQICTRNALHATFNPRKWQGERLWIVALHGQIAVQDDKIAALKREIIAEVV